MKDVKLKDDTLQNSTYVILKSKTMVMENRLVIAR